MTGDTSTTALVKTLRGGADEAAWTLFCQRYEPLVNAFVRQAGVPRDDVADVVQETLVAFLESLRAGRYDPQRGRVRAWIRGIALHKVQEALRKIRRPERQVVDESGTTRFMNRVVDERELTDLFEAEWERGLLQAGLARVRCELDPKTLAAFELYALAGWPPEQVAERLGLSRQTVYVHKNRVLTRLRQILEELGEGP